MVITLRTGHFFRVSDVFCHGIVFWHSYQCTQPCFQVTWPVSRSGDTPKMASKSSKGKGKSPKKKTTDPPPVPSGKWKSTNIFNFKSLWNTQAKDSCEIFSGNTGNNHSTASCNFTIIKCHRQLLYQLFSISAIIPSIILCIYILYNC